MHQERVNNSGEIQLLIALKSGDRSAFEKIYHSYSPRIYLNILKMVKSVDDAQEILQDVFVKVWEKRELIDPEQAFKAYLFQISRFTVYNFIRKVNLDKKLKAYLAHENSELYTHIEETIACRENDQFILNAIEELPPQRKQIYKLCKIEGKSYIEVGKLLGISSSTINDHIVKATKFLKDRHSSFGAAVTITVISLFLKNL
ncbi:MAG TPA: RNA polymerase sigma-70 factor [Pedobacter sp.]|uniref:RNA polymerase sigma factor n=1 Tax=Pedobacter sp. TaxID=1411316 RepID=UPI002C85CAE6|nr:RNA polymerase sigma-70 factor [Pedobacter sp.]HMI02142.1 RNA polymerase sigma-70 factor [Pedobacter sp.]